ncbi:MAG: septum formation initiator family protein [Peptococcaceae bacterium]
MAYKKAAGTEYIPDNYPVQKQQKKVKVRPSSRPSWILRVSPSLAVIALIFIIGMGFVAQHVWINYLGYQVSELKQDIAGLQVNNEKLKLKIASYASLDTIENLAKTQLGMINPESESMHFIVDKENNPEVDASERYRAIVLAPKAADTSSPNQLAEKAWLGTIEDFFYQWLLGKK